MWLLLAFLSAALLGFYDAFKKQALKDNAVLPVLFLNTVFSSLIFLPFILVSCFAPAVLGGTMFDVPVVGWGVHKFIIIKSFIVLSSWIFGYFGMKHLPLTIVGPINATRPVMVLVGAMLVFGERLNLYQWIGVMLAVLSFFMLSRSVRKRVSTSSTINGILFICTGGRDGCCQRIIRQVSDEAAAAYGGAVMVQHLSGVYHVSHYPVAVVSQEKGKYTVPLGLDYHRYIRLSLCSRLCVFLCLEL